MHNINNTLRSNYRLLAELNTQGKTETTKARPAGVSTLIISLIFYRQKPVIPITLYMGRGYMALENDYYIG